MERQAVIRTYTLYLSILISILMFFIRLSKGDWLSLIWLFKSMGLAVVGGILFWFISTLVLDIIFMTLIDTAETMIKDKWEGGLVAHLGLSSTKEEKSENKK